MQDNQERTAAPRDIILGACPPFHPGAPHLGLAYLDEYLNHHGFRSRVYDLSLEFRDRVELEERYLWGADSWSRWQHEGFAEDFCRRHEAQLEQCVTEMLAGDPLAVGLSMHIHNAITSVIVAPTP